MASGLYNLQASVSRNLTRCIKHSSDVASLNKSRWRSVTSFAISPGFVDDSNVDEVQKPSVQTNNRTLINLKEREKGDWRNLTLEEKQNHGENFHVVHFLFLDGTHVYRMSFSQPFHVLEQPADEWKLILAGTFTAMGLMTLGMYMWNSQFEKTETVIGPLSLKKELKDAEVNLFFGNGSEKAA